MTLAELINTCEIAKEAFSKEGVNLSDVDILMDIKDLDKFELILSSNILISNKGCILQFMNYQPSKPEMKQKGYEVFEVTSDGNMKCDA